MDFREYIFKMDVRSKILGIFAALVAVSFLFYNFSISTLRNEQKKLRMNLASNKKVLEARIENIKQMGTLEAESKKAKNKLKDIENMFLTEEELPSFFTEFRSLASGNNVEILRLNIKEKASAESSVDNAAFKYEKVPIDISLKGTYFDVLVFLSEFRKNRVIFGISELNMSAENKNNRNESITVDFQLVLYVVSKQDVKN